MENVHQEIHCLKSVQFRNFYGPHFPAFGLNTDQKNPNTFHTVINTLRWAFKNNGYPKNFIDLYIKKNLNKLFVKNKVSLKVRKLQLVCVLPNTGKSFLDLRSRLTRMTEKNIPLVSLMLFQDSPADLVTCLNKIPSRKKYSLEYSFAMYVIITRLLTTKKLSVNFFTTVLRQIWELEIWQENVSKKLKSRQYLITCCNVTPL